MSASADSHSVVHQLSNRRLFQASARVLDAVTEELAEVRARTGGGPTAADYYAAGAGEADDWGIGVSAEFELGLRDIAVGAAYQASMRTASTIRQRSLAEFLK
jgi:hypothetical protein